MGRAQPNDDPPCAVPVANNPMRERILAGAIACFVRGGFHASSMQEICAEAKMSPGALYRYFPSKDAIIEAIAELERERNRRLLQQLDQAKDNILATFLDVGFVYMREMAAGRASLCSEVFAEAQRNPRIRAIFERNDAEARASIRRALERAAAAGEIDSGADLEVVVALLMAIGDGFVLRGPFQPDLPIDRIEAPLRELVQRMLAPKSAPSDPQPRCPSPRAEATS